jgi:hypothetical protein
MTRTATALVHLSIATALGGAALFWNGNLPLDRQASLISAAEARIGRPATPRSFAGVARRTDRRVTRRVVGATAAGVALGTAAAVAAAPAAAVAQPSTSPQQSTSGQQSTSAQQPTSAQTGAIRSACRADYQAHCAGVPTGGAAALQCLQNHVATLSQACQTAVNAASGAAKSAAAPATAAVEPAEPAPAVATAPAALPEAAPAAPLLRLRELTPRQALIALRFACGPDFRALCGGTPLGGGRAIACLRDNGASLSPRCRGALTGAL